MGLIDIARDTLKEIPMADILRERLSLALDQSLVFERQVAVMQTELGKLLAQLEVVAFDRDKAREELQRLKDEHSEEIRIHHFIEFRRGKRSDGKWAAFCPKCHMPATHPRNETANVICSDRACKWHVSIDRMMSEIISEIGG